MCLMWASEQSKRMNQRKQRKKEKNNVPKKKIISFPCGRWWTIMFRISNDSVIHYVMREFMLRHAWDFKISDVKKSLLDYEHKMKEK